MSTYLNALITPSFLRGFGGYVCKRRVLCAGLFRDEMCMKVRASESDV